MSDDEEVAPGITFSMVSVTANVTAAGAKVRRIVLDCTVDDEELWPAIEKQLETFSTWISMPPFSTAPRE